MSKSNKKEVCFGIALAIIGLIANAAMAYSERSIKPATIVVGSMCVAGDCR